MKIFLIIFVLAWFVMGIIFITGAIIHEYFVKSDNQKEER